MPELSAILNMPVDFASIRKTIQHMAAQTARDRLEVVIVTTPTLSPLIDSAAFHSIGAWQVVEIAEIQSGAQAWAAGIAAAQSPVIVLAEDHSFPEPNWAETLIRAHRQDCVAVAPGVGNGNPATLTSWANFLLCFLDWYAPDSPRMISAGPGHNTSYKRAALAPYGRDLAYWLNPERVLHLEFERKGLPIILAAETSTSHVNISRFMPYLRQSFFGGRIFGASRSQPWSWPKKLIYALAFGLVPPLRWFRIYKALATPAKRAAARFWPAQFHIAAGLWAHAAGELAGYLFGAGDSVKTYMSFEMRRSDFVVAGERELLRLSNQ